MACASKIEMKTHDMASIIGVNEIYQKYFVGKQSRHLYSKRGNIFEEPDMQQMG